MPLSCSLPWHLYWTNNPRYSAINFAQPMGFSTRVLYRHMHSTDQAPSLRSLPPQSKGYDMILPWRPTPSPTATSTSIPTDIPILKYQSNKRAIYLRLPYLYVIPNHTHTKQNILTPESEYKLKVSLAPDTASPKTSIV